MHYGATFSLNLHACLVLNVPPNNCRHFSPLRYVAKQADREQEAAEKKEAKLAKLRKIAKGENKHEFHDPKYAKEREESTSRYVEL